MADMLKRPKLGEVADDKRGSVYTDNLIDNEDSILNERGGGELKIYAEVLKDDQVKSTLEQRRRAVVSSEIDVVAASDSADDQAAADHLREQLKGFNFDRKTDLMLYGMFYGYSVGELIFAEQNSRVVLSDIKVRDRANFRMGRDGHIYKISMAHPMGERMPANKFWWFNSGADNDDQPYGLGLAHWLYWLVFFKRNGLKYWSVFLEKFAQPTPTATMSKAQLDDPRMKRKALEALQAIQVDSGVLIPEGVVIDLLEAARSGSGDYESLRQAMDASIAKVVLSQTMTTDNGSSRSQAEVHKDVKEEVVKADADLICESFNNTVVRWLTAWNFPNANPPKIWRKTEPEEDMQKRVEIDKGIYSMGFEPTDDYIRDNYGEGWQRRTNAPLPTQPTHNQIMPEFAENSPLAVKRNARRKDTARVIAGAERIASDSDAVIGQQINQLINYAEASGDLETFRKQLNELLAQGPSPQTVEAINHALVSARLLGNLRAQR